MNQTQLFLANYQASYQATSGYKWGYLLELIRPVNYERWMKRLQITPLEFGFIVSGFEPIPSKKISDILSELQKVLFSIKQHTFQEMYSNKDFIASVRALFPDKKEDEVINKILQHSQHLLDILEIINRGMTAISIECKSCFSVEQSQFKERLWRFDFLIHWAKTDLNLSLPTEIFILDGDFNVQKELNDHFGNTIIQKFNESELIIQGWFNLNNCRAPKLRALIEAYVNEEELCKKNPSRNFSTGNIQTHLKTDFEIIGSDGDNDNFLKNLSHVASIAPKGASLKKRISNK